jgi:heme/copper-type cytochrome/quinol oxidase subunit 2
MPARLRAIVAWIVVILTVLAVWKFSDSRNQPPAISSVAVPR